MIAFDDEDLMPFGKFKGKRLADVPADYLLWYYDTCREKSADGLDATYPAVFGFIEAKWGRLQKEAEDYESKYKPRNK